ncbi:cytochrome c oxidase assembly protein [Pelagibius marinus]|uniref:cytochrome c oxidase assembly protein n=1 Tax=Pelagibius marinus TaxID=2762760 RepID=UPI0018726288|nr:cytochrome c oxidase assembly protein [Pelagibius marinus]
MAQRKDTKQRSKSNRFLGLALVGVAAGMIGAAYASVPLYQLFCQVTGYGGTTQVAEAAPETVGERVITVRFNSDVDPQLPWSFQPVQREMTLKVGESGLAFFRARNLAARATVGTATFNVTPLKAGPYFNKVQCFCFTEQQLAAGGEADMPVTFFVDPEIENDPNLAEVDTITLSYTMFVDEDAQRELDAEQQLGQLQAPAGSVQGEATSVN